MVARVEIRRLTQDDAAAVWHLRLEALESDPLAFGESADEHRQRSVESLKERLQSESVEDFILGAFDGSELVGMVGFRREPRRKRRHLGVIWGMYVRSSHRNRGIARMLVSNLIERASTVSGLARIHLSVTVDQAHARTLYKSLGFRVFGIEPQALSLDGRTVDQEHMSLSLSARH